MHPGTDFFARLAMVLTHIRKKAFQIFTSNYLPSLFHTHHSGAPLDNQVSLWFFSPQWRQLFEKVFFYT